MSGYKRVNYYELCRLCTSSEGLKIHIFCEDGKRRQLQNKIQICLPLKVCEDDSLPKIVCAGCLEKLEHFYDFRESCISSEGMLESYFTSMRFSHDMLKEGKVYIKEPTQKLCKPAPASTPVQHSPATLVSTSSADVQSTTNQQPVMHQQQQQPANNAKTSTMQSIQTINNNISNISNGNPVTPNFHIANIEMIPAAAGTGAQQLANSNEACPIQSQAQIVPQFMISLAHPPSNEVLQLQIKDGTLQERLKILEQIPTFLTQNICLKCKQFMSNDDVATHVCSENNYLMPETELPTQNVPVQEQNNSKSNTNKTIITNERPKLKKELRTNVMNTNSQPVLSTQIGLSQNTISTLLNVQNMSSNAPNMAAAQQNVGMSSCQTNCNMAFSQTNLTNSLIENHFNQSLATYNNTQTNELNAAANNQFTGMNLNTLLNAATAPQRVKMERSPVQNPPNENTNTTINTSTNYIISESPQSNQQNMSPENGNISPPNTSTTTTTVPILSQLPTITVSGFDPHPLNISENTNDETTVQENNSENKSPNKTWPQNSANTGIFICETCDKTFKRKEHLIQHRKLHSGERPFVCSECHKSFSRKEHLIRHSISHTGAKCFQCELCHKSFSRKDNLHKHKKTHEVSGPYVCDVCNKSFVIKHYYALHKLTHQDADDKTTGKIVTTTKKKSKQNDANLKLESSIPLKTTPELQQQQPQPTKKKDEDNFQTTDPNRNPQLMVQTNTINDNMINLGQITLQNGLVSQQNTINLTKNLQNIPSFPANNSQTRNINMNNEQVQAFVQNLAQQNVITSLGQNVNHLTVVQNLVPISGTNLSELPFTTVNNRAGVNVTNKLHLIEQSKHLAQILTNQKYRDKYANSNLKVESIVCKDNGTEKNIITPLLNQTGIIVVPSQNQNFIFNSHEIVKKTTPEQKSKKIKFSQANHMDTNTAIVSNLNQIGGGKSNVLFSSTSSKPNSVTTNVINSTVINSMQQNHLYNANTTGHNHNVNVSTIAANGSLNNTHFICERRNEIQYDFNKQMNN